MFAVKGNKLPDAGSCMNDEEERKRDVKKPFVFVQLHRFAYVNRKKNIGWKLWNNQLGNGSKGYTNVQILLKSSSC